MIPLKQQLVMALISLTVALSQHMVRIRYLSQELGIYKNELAKLQVRVEELLKK